MSFVNNIIAKIDKRLDEQNTKEQCEWNFLRELKRDLLELNEGKNFSSNTSVIRSFFCLHKNNTQEEYNTPCKGQCFICKDLKPMALKYKVVVSGTPIENKDMQEVISERLAKKNIPIDEKTLLAVTDAVMHHIYKLNMEWKHDLT